MAHPQAPDRAASRAPALCWILSPLRVVRDDTRPLSAKSSMGRGYFQCRSGAGMFASSQHVQLRSPTVCQALPRGPRMQCLDLMLQISEWMPQA